MITIINKTKNAKVSNAIVAQNNTMANAGKSLRTLGVSIATIPPAANKRFVK